MVRPLQYEVLGRESRQDASSRKHNAVNVNSQGDSGPISPNSERGMPQDSEPKLISGRSSTPATASQQLPPLPPQESETLGTPKSDIDLEWESWQPRKKYSPKTEELPHTLIPVEPATPTTTSPSDSNLSPATTPRHHSEDTSASSMPALLSEGSRFLRCTRCQGMFRTRSELK
jgi:hypothetical protein